MAVTLGGKTVIFFSFEKGQVMAGGYLELK